MAKDRVLLKISGGNLKADTEGKGIFTHDVILHLAEQIRDISKEYAVALTVGGGNIWRGDENSLVPIEEADAHTIGMIATVINAVALQNYLRYIGVSSTIFSSFPFPKVAKDVCIDSINKALDSGEVCIFAGGTGLPFLTTDTLGAVRALEVKAKKILIGKNVVNGIYDKNPSKYPDARFLPKVKYEEIIANELAILDLTSILLLRDNTRPQLIVFNQSEKNAFSRALKGDITHTLVY